MRAIMAMGMETPMPAFAPAERPVEAGEVEEVSCVLEAEVDVPFSELVVEKLVEVAGRSNASEANNFGIAVSVLCQATGMPSQRTDRVGSTVINDTSLGKPFPGEPPVAFHTFVKVVFAKLEHVWSPVHVKPLPRIVIQLSSNKS
jgi:hypothetical protein